MMKQGDKVKYTEENPSKEQIAWGGHDDPTELLEAGIEYTAEKIEVRSWHTKVYLKEFPDKHFNSVWFEGI